MAIITIVGSGMIAIDEIAKSLQINIENADFCGDYPIFFSKIAGKRVCVVSDANTNQFAREISAKIQARGGAAAQAFFDEKELIPDEHVYEGVEKIAKETNSEYILAVGSGSLNDVCKYVSTRLSVPCGVLATACSMDGYVSKGAALMEKQFKVTETVHTPSDVLINADVLVTAPRIMTAAGFGDIMGKYTCLADWRLSHIFNGEPINEEAYRLMEQAREDCKHSFPELLKYDKAAIEKLMNALVVAGLAMAICGNSRPASGSEHHMSHYLEMDFVSRGEPVPPHGVKVAIGTLISIEIYNFLREHRVQFPHCEEAYSLCGELPEAQELKSMFEKIGCPTRFSQIGVRRETMEAMLEKAYAVRDRYTVLTLVHRLNLTEKIKPIVMEKYF